MCFSAFCAAEAEALWNTTHSNVRLFAVQMIRSATPEQRFPPVTNSSECSWNHYKAPDQAALPCNAWLPAAPQYNRYFSAVALFTALEVMRLHTGPRPVGIIFSAFGGTSISEWAPPSVLDSSCPAPADPAGGQLWNAMVAPMTRYSVRSFLWFQGEQDVATEAKAPNWYACRHEKLIAYWRRVWAMGDIAFNFVQLGPAVQSEPEPQYGLVRAAQTAALPRPLGTTDISGMAVAYDLGDASSPFTSVHFRNKTEVARRLAAAVLHSQFALQNASLRGPSLVGFSDVSETAVTIDVHVPDGSDLRLVSTSQCTLCCERAMDSAQLSADNGLTWANTTIAITGSSVKVTARSPAQVPFTHVRLAWTSYPECAVVGAGNGFPLAAFSLPVAPLRTADAWSLPPPMAVAGARLNHGGMLVWKGNVYEWSGNTSPPPLGLNTWNSFHCNIDESIVLGLCDAFVSLGLKSAGYSYINIDDGWQVSRMQNGTIVEDPVRFPSGMRALAAGVHSRGLRFGLYTSQTALTCQKRPGSYSYEAIDIERYCDWGVDYIKVDSCGGTRWPASNTSWIRMRSAIEACAAAGGHRQILGASSCEAGSGCAVWIGDLADLWRTTGDVQANWASIMSNLDRNNANAAASRPGKYNDPDMLVLGQPGVSLTEAQTQFAAWALVTAPLLLSLDIRQDLAAGVLEIATNAEVLAVSQDAAQVQGVRVSAAAPYGQECWARPLAPRVGQRQLVAALLLNRDSARANATCTWADLGLSSAAAVRDTYNHENLGTANGSFTAELESHASLLVTLAVVA
jgi:alpha-galactosidase